MSIFIIICSIIIIKLKTGWVEFSLKHGENFNVTIPPKEVSNINFRDCKYSVTSTQGSTKEVDVTSILNNMVSAYKNNTIEDLKFRLSDPGLSSYSFTIPGLSDPATLNGRTSLPAEWDTTRKVTLIGKYYIK